MASITPRASGFWADRRMSSYFPDEEGGEGDVEQQSLMQQENDGRTPLDKTIDRIGMGSYQWTLLSLCGFGWLADNMWMEAVAIILPRVQRHYNVPDSYIGTLSSSMFAGMMIGAVGWGTCSDIMGRSAAFNATLCFTALFGLLASFSSSFFTLCMALFFLGSAVGGSMPTDGTLLLEHMPRSKQYLVTALSVFFSVGAVLAAIVALIVIPQHSCLPNQPCNVDVDNQGWRYLLTALGLITLSMFLARIIFFRLHESPRYLVSAGRPLEAIESLQMISRFNGSDLSLEIGDVADHHSPSFANNLPIPRPNKRNEHRPRPTSTTMFSAIDIENETHLNSPTAASNAPNGNGRSTLVTQYNSTDASHNSLQGHAFATPAEEHLAVFPDPNLTINRNSQETVNKTTPSPRSPTTPRAPLPPSLSNRNSRRLSSASRLSLSASEKDVCSALPSRVRKPLRIWWSRTGMVLSPEWRRTTVLVWTIWFTMSLAYTMFNVYLPKLLETSRGPEAVVNDVKTLEETLWDVVIFTLGGCPGAILGAYLIESTLGRRWSLTGSTFVTAFFCIVFVMVESPWAVRASTVGISLSATTMWAVLYGWTPEIFGTKVRGTASGIASALSRIGGMIAPILGGMLMTIDRSVPVYASIVIFVIAGCCVLLLREGEGDSIDRVKGERAIVH